MDKNEVKKDLFKSKAMAKFSHYIAGNLYYNVEVFGELYEFPIPTVDFKFTDLQDGNEFRLYELSEDLGTTRFDNEIKGSELSRWITKAIEKEEFVKISK
jgi:hypothetical protein